MTILTEAQISALHDIQRDANDRRYEAEWEHARILANIEKSRRAQLKSIGLAPENYPPNADEWTGVRFTLDYKTYIAWDEQRDARNGLQFTRGDVMIGEHASTYSGDEDVIRVHGEKHPITGIMPLRFLTRIEP